MDLEKKKLRLGIIGVSDGNGHPYSWSSIFNGYDKTLMKSCPYPGIPKYLERYTFPEVTINNASVSHIWTQNKKDSTKIANTTFIKNIVDHPNEMIGHVDGILLARDDYKNHYELARNFIEAGLPIYIDKPLGINVDMAKKILDMQKYEGQVFTGSALAYDPLLENLKEDLKSCGKLKFIFGTAPGSWDKYSVHLIDPILKVLDKKFEIKESTKLIEGKYSNFRGVINDNCYFSLQCLGGIKSPMRITFIADKGFKEIEFHEDPFLAFKSALVKFTNNITKKNIIRSKKDIIQSIKLISLGINI